MADVQSKLKHMNDEAEESLNEAEAKHKSVFESKIVVIEMWLVSFV